MKLEFNKNWLKSIFRFLVLSVAFFVNFVFGAQPTLNNLQIGQFFPLEERMALCEDARELRTKLLSGKIHEFQVQCKYGVEKLTVKLNGAEEIYLISHRKDYESGISKELIEKLRADQIEKYGKPDIENHKLPESFSGEVWQYGWGKTCFVDPETGLITAGKNSGYCLVVGTDLTASKKLVVEDSELIDPNLDPGYKSSKDYELEYYTKAKGARILNFSK